MFKKFIHLAIIYLDYEIFRFVNKLRRLPAINIQFKSRKKSDSDAKKRIRIIFHCIKHLPRDLMGHLNENHHRGQNWVVDIH